MLIRGRMNKTRKAVIAVLGIMGVGCYPGWAEVSLVGQDKAPPSQIIVKFRRELSRPIEDLLPRNLKYDKPGHNKSLESIFDQYALKDVLDKYNCEEMRPLFEDLVRQKKQKGKSEAQIFQEIKDKFAERARRAPKEARMPENLSGTYVLKFDASMPWGKIQEILAVFRQNSQVEYAEQDGWAQAAMIPNDPRWSSSYGSLAEYDLFQFRTTGKLGVPREDFERAWDVTTGAGVVVAVTDTGVDCGHPDMAANCWTNPREIPGNGIDDDSNGYVDDTRGWDFINNDNNTADDDSHGTHVAGTIAAVGNNSLDVIGGAFGSKIMPVKVLGADGSGPWSSVANGTSYACNNGADVINASLGAYGFVQAMADAVAVCRSLGVIYVAAAGNDNSDCATRYPCNYSGVQCVASLNDTDIKSGFSNWGNCVDVAAYGRDIISLQAGGLGISGTVRQMSGTSMATPQVAALSALILSRNPAFSDDQVAQIIRTTADDLYAVGFDTSTGYGRINAWRAVQVGSALEAIITAPLVGDKLTTNLNVTGKACGANFSNYSLEIGAGQNPTAWAMLTNSPTQVCGVGTGGVLGPIDIASLIEGTTYTIRLTVTDTSGTHFIDRAGDLPVAILPSVTITAPQDGLTYGGRTVAVAGTASDNSTVSRVEVQLDNDPYIEASGTLNWNYDLPIPQANYQAHIIRARATDSFGNQQTASVSIVVDSRLPVISSVLADQIGAASARITWTTDKNADSQVEYGLSTSYGNTTTLASALVTSHSQSLTGLSASTLHHYRVCSADAYSNRACSADNTFTTAAPDTTAPTVSITAPAAAATVSGSAVTVSADASDNVGVTSAQFLLDGANLGSADTTSPYSISWDSTLASDGAHTLSARASDAAGNTATSAAITVTVDNAAPVISAVASSAITDTLATITWTTGETADSRVEYGLTTAYGSLTTLDTALVASHSVNLTGLTASTLYHFRVRSADASANVATSGDFTFTTTAAPDTTAPTVSITAPAAAATVSGAAVTVSASASDNVGVVGVQFRLDGANLGAEDLSAPYSIAWDSTLAIDGVHTLSALARDAAGNQATATGVSVTVDNSAPTFSAIVASAITEVSATISWTTNEASNSQVEYGLSTSYGNTTTLASALVTSHSQSLTGLSASTLYHYRVCSADAYSNRACSADNTFSTAVPPDTTAPSVSITAPAGGAIVVGAITVSGVASDNVGVTRVDIYVDGALRASASGTVSWSYSLDTTALANGSRVILARAYDAAGNSSDASISVTVNNDGSNLLGNSGFESATGWSFCGTYCSRNSLVSRTGSYSASIMKTSAGTSDVYLNPKLAGITAGQRYRVSSWVRRDSIGGSSSSGARVTVRWYSSAGAQLREDIVCSALRGTADWSQCNQAFFSPAGSVSASVYLRLYSSSGTVWFDDVNLQVAAPDLISPVISAVSASGITDTQATIAWTTDENANSQVEYGVTASYGLTTTLDSALVTGHSQNLTSLSGSTLYHYRVCSADATGNRGCSSDQTFTTLAPPTVGLNLVSNPGFESGTTGWSFCGTYCSRDTSIYYSGVASAKITRTSVGASDTYNNPRITGVIAGQSYRTAVLIRRDAVAGSSSSYGVRVVVRWYNSASSQIGGDNTVCSGLQGTVGWTACTGALMTAPVGATQARVYLRLYNATGSVWFDDVTFNQVTYGSSLGTLSLVSDFDGSEESDSSEEEASRADHPDDFEVTAVPVAVMPKFLTPYNIDGVNDKMVFPENVEQIRVFNSFGQELVHALKGGSRILVWDGKDSAGNLFESGGPYIIQMIQNDGKTKYHPFVVVK